MSDQPSTLRTSSAPVVGSVDPEVSDAVTAVEPGVIDLRSAPNITPDDARVGSMAGRLAVVTGGSGRLGGAIAVALARAGARVCVIGRDLPRLRATTEAAGRSAPMLYLQCDLGSAREIEGLGEFIERFDRPIDMLVHAAGVSVEGSFEEADSADLDEQYLVNVRGLLLATQTFLPQLRQGSGQVVFLVPTIDAETSTLARVAAASATALADGLQREESGGTVRVSTIGIGSVARPAPADAVADAVVQALRLTAGAEVLSGVDLRLRSA